MTHHPLKDERPSQSPFHSTDLPPQTHTLTCESHVDCLCRFPSRLHNVQTASAPPLFFSLHVYLAMITISSLQLCGNQLIEHSAIRKQTDTSGWMVRQHASIIQTSVIPRQLYTKVPFCPWNRTFVYPPPPEIFTLLLTKLNPDSWFNQWCWKEKRSSHGNAEFLRLQLITTGSSCNRLFIHVNSISAVVPPKSMSQNISAEHKTNQTTCANTWHWPLVFSPCSIVCEMNGRGSNNTKPTVESSKHFLTLESNMMNETLSSALHHTKPTFVLGPSDGHSLNPCFCSPQPSSVLPCLSLSCPFSPLLFECSCSSPRQPVPFYCTALSNTMPSFPTYILPSDPLLPLLIHHFLPLVLPLPPRLPPEIITTSLVQISLYLNSWISKGWGRWQSTFSNI